MLLDLSFCVTNSLVVNAPNIHFLTCTGIRCRDSHCENGLVRCCPYNVRQAPLRFLRSFCFARIRLDPLGGQVLHHDCISIIVSRFTSFTENFVICCYQVTKIFCTKYGAAIASSARGPCNFGPLTYLAISTFREMSINTVLTQILTSLGCGL